MEIISNLFYGFPDFWGGGVAHSVMILSLVVSVGLSLGKLNIFRISLGLVWVLFLGILFGSLGFNLESHLLHFVKEFGLILFVYSIGMEVSRGFFDSFRRNGLSLNMLSALIVISGIAVTLGIHALSGTPVTSMVGILSGAVTNTPGLGAAQQAYSDLRHIDPPEIAVGYAAAYPIGVIGVIITFIALKWAFRANIREEEKDAVKGTGKLENVSVRQFSVRADNSAIFGKNIKEIKRFLNRPCVISRIVRKDSQEELVRIHGDTEVHEGDKLMIVSAPQDAEPIQILIGGLVNVDWASLSNHKSSSSVMLTHEKINGSTLAQLRIRTIHNVNVSHVTRAGMDFIAHGGLALQLGDRLHLVGAELDVINVEKILGGKEKSLDIPNLIPIFLGIALGCLVANIPIPLPGVDSPVRLGLTGGPLVVAILMGFFGPKCKLVTYNTISANLMLRELGICLFLASVGLGVGDDFLSTIATVEGLRWLGFGALVTLIPVIIGAIVGHYALHLNYYTLLGVLAGTNTNPPALSYARSLTQTDQPAIAYSTVYPFAMVLRIITIQILVLVWG